LKCGFASESDLCVELTKEEKKIENEEVITAARL
jgi:hypothetical protein